MSEPANPTWSWPTKITSFPELLSAVSNGFDIVLMSDSVWGTSYYVLARDGRRSSREQIRQDVAIKFINRGQMGSPMRLADGAWLYKRTTRC